MSFIPFRGGTADHNIPVPGAVILRICIPLRRPAPKLRAVPEFARPGIKTIIYHALSPTEGDIQAWAHWAASTNNPGSDHVVPERYAVNSTGYDPVLSRIAHTVIDVELGS